MPGGRGAERRWQQDSRVGKRQEEGAAGERGRTKGSGKEKEGGAGTEGHLQHATLVLRH